MNKPVIGNGTRTSSADPSVVETLKRIREREGHGDEVMVEELTRLEFLERSLEHAAAEVERAREAHDRAYARVRETLLAHNQIRMDIAREKRGK